MWKGVDLSVGMVRTRNKEMSRLHAEMHRIAPDMTVIVAINGGHQAPK